jgi:hypothetical protein
MAPRNLSPDRTTLDDLLYEILYTLIRLRLIPLTSQRAVFEALHTEAKAVRDEENQLLEQVRAAEVEVGWRDESINMSVRSLSTTLLGIAHNDRNDPRYLLYFGGQIPSDLTRTALGRKLVTVRGWIETLKASPHEDLVALGELIEQQATAADEAIAAEAQAQQKLDNFRLVGARRHLFDRVNTERKSAFGELARVVLSDEDLRMRSDSGDLFFRQLRRRDADDSSEAARKVVDRARKALAEAEAQLKEAEERERAEAEAETRRAADKAALETIQRNVAEQNRAARELRERLARR